MNKNSILKQTITNEELNSLELNHYQGKIVVCESKENIETLCDELKKEKILGFDTETRPSFKKGKVYQVSLLQLSTDKKTYLFRLNKIGLPECLRNILADSDIVKVGAAIRDDIKGLQKLGEFKAQNFIDLQKIVKELNVQSISLKKLTGIFLNFRISKSQRITNWDADKLSEKQIIYAATDSWVSLEIYKKILSIKNNQSFFS